MEIFRKSPENISELQPEPQEQSEVEEEATSFMDKELEEILSKQKARIKVIGSGGAGNNTINRMSEVGISGAEMIAIKIIINITAVGTDSSPCQINLLIGSKMGTGQ